MPTRLLSLLQIILLLACPLWCMSGECDRSCCAVTPGMTFGPADCDAAQTECCSCCCETAAQQDEAPPAPQRRPGQSRCQGVCGGAVIEKPVELSSPSTWSLQVVTDAGTSAALQRTRLQRSDVDRHSIECDMTSGRTLRQIHMSLLC